MADKKKSIPKVKEPIKVRLKNLRNGNKSVYLDCCRNGKREREFLKLYIIPERTAADKKVNSETIRLANAVKAERIVELQNAAHGFSMTGGRSKMNVLEYVKNNAEKKLAKAKAEGRDMRSSGYQQMMALHRHIQEYSGTKTNFRQVDKKYCLGFIDYMKTAKNVNAADANAILSENTQAEHLRRFNYILNCAISDEITNTNPLKHINPECKPKKRQKEIVYLTLEEVETLEKTECLHQIIKQTFLFSCYTGLAFSEVRDLTWGKLQKDMIRGGFFIVYTRKKTKKPDILPIPEKAEEFLPDRADAKDTDKVFKLPSGGYTNLILKSWAAVAGLKKHLTYHVSRRSCATNLLTLGASMEQVSGVLAHASVQITQAAYGVIETKLKRDAMNLFDKRKGLTD